MQLRIIFSMFFFFLVSTLSMAEHYTVTVYGKLLDSSGKPIPNKTIYISSPKGSKYTVSEKTSTFESGEFKWPVYIHDSIPSGVLLISFVNCDNKEVVTEHRFSKEHKTIETKLIYCSRSNECASEIILKRLNDTLSIAIVNAKGKAPFKHKWSTGAEGDTIRFNNRTDQRICVVTTTADTCITEACVKSIAEHCKSEIKIVRVNDSLSLAIVIAKGQAPFKYKWTTGSGNDTLRFNPHKDLAFCVSVVDASNCISTSCYARPCVSVVVARRVNDSVAIAYVVTKGKAPYTHVWTTGQTGDTIRFNPQNKIRICVRSVDADHCVSEACVINIAEPCRGVIEQVKNVLYAYLKGDIVKSYKWNNGSDDPRIEIKEKGEYCVTMIGLSGCEVKTCIKVESIGNVECKAEIIMDTLGSINQDAIPGVKLIIRADFPLKFIQWSTGESKEFIIVRKSGEYCVSISDNVQCKSFICKKVSLENDKCSATILQEKLPLSSTSSFARIRLTVKPNFEPKIISWSTGDTTRSVIVEKTGTYCVTLSDGINCKIQECIKVEIPIVTPAFCSSVIIVKPVSATEVKLLPRVDGKLPFTFVWTTGSKDAQISVTKTGMYCITITDGGGCVTKSCVEVEITGSGLQTPGTDNKETESKVNIEKKSLKLSLYPNPAPDKVNFEVSALIDGDAQMTVINMYGKRVYQEKINIKHGNSVGQLDLSFLSAGVYQIIFEQKGYMTTSKLIIGK